MSISVPQVSIFFSYQICSMEFDLPKYSFGPRVLICLVRLSHIVDSPYEKNQTSPDVFGSTPSHIVDSPYEKNQSSPDVYGSALSHIVDSLYEKNQTSPDVFGSTPSDIVVSPYERISHRRMSSEVRWAISLTLFMKRIRHRRMSAEVRCNSAIVLTASERLLGIEIADSVLGCIRLHR